MLLNRTGIVFNLDNFKTFGLDPYIYRCRGCIKGLNGNTPADQYQKQKIIQNTVRVQPSLYTMNLASLSSYQTKPDDVYRVGWNQQSDRAYPSVQNASIKTGFNNSMNGRHRSFTSSRPGTQTPGGVGCDIKHNSYDRFLNKLKGRKILRRGVVPPTFGLPNVPFNPAYPVYGAKQFNTGIINGCNCNLSVNDDAKLYENPYSQDVDDITFHYGVGMFVYAFNNMTGKSEKAKIIEDLGDNTFIIQFDNGYQKTVSDSDLILYFPCNCIIGINTTKTLDVLANGIDPICFIPNYDVIKNI
jgi:hypothetical protein